LAAPATGAVQEIGRLSAGGTLLDAVEIPDDVLGEWNPWRTRHPSKTPRLCDDAYWASELALADVEFTTDVSSAGLLTASATRA